MLLEPMHKRAVTGLDDLLRRVRLNVQDPVIVPFILHNLLFSDQPTGNHRNPTGIIPALTGNMIRWFANACAAAASN